MRGYSEAVLFCINSSDCLWCIRLCMIGLRKKGILNQLNNLAAERKLCTVQFVYITGTVVIFFSFPFLSFFSPKYSLNV
jgi:hypothetical protein